MSKLACLCRPRGFCVGRGASVSAAKGLCRTAAPESQLSCNVTTFPKYAIFDGLQEKIRSIASRPAQKVTEKSSEQSIKSVSQAACACVGQKCPTQSPPPSLPKNNHTVNRRQCCETIQSSCNVPSILQRANFLATSQHLLNVPSLTSYKRKFGA